MEAILPRRLVLLLSTVMFMTSCAKPAITPIYRTHIPPENLPQIGGKQSPSSMEKPRPVIVENMISTAKKQLEQNRLEEAFQTLERALAVDGRDPMVWHLMARVRMAQKNYAQAESLARKSNTLASGNPSLVKKNRQIIAAAQKP